MPIAKLRMKPPPRSIAFAVAIFLSACSGGTSTSTPTPTPAPPTFSLSGTITSGLTRHAIRGATVSVVDGPSAGKSATADASGSYSFAGLQQSGFTVSASANGYVSASQGVTLTSTQTLSFQLTPVPTPWSYAISADVPLP